MELNLKQIEIRLTDIFREREKQLSSLRKKTANLSRCQRASEMINKHLIRCNETLLAIIDKCRIDLVDNKEIIELITFIKDDENSIAMWKNRLNSYKRELNYDNDNEEYDNSLTNYCQKCLTMSESLDKCVQTEPNNVTVINLNEFNDNNSNVGNELALIDNNDIKPEYNAGNVHIYNVECRVEFNNELNEQINEQTAIIIADNYREDERNIHSVICTDDRSLQPIDLECHNSETLCIDLPSDSESNFCMSNDERIINNSSDTDWEIDTKRRRKRKLGNKSSKPKSQSKPKTPQNPKPPRPPKTIKEVTVEDCAIIQKRSEQQLYVDQMLAEFKYLGKYVCSKLDCDFASPKRCAFIRHINKHNGAENTKILRPYVCDWPGCNKAYKGLNHLKNHKNFWHENYRPFECDWPGCGFKLRREIDLNIHRRIHTKEKPLACEWPGCAFSCNAKWSLIAHRRKHTGEKPYECLWPDCNYRCSQPGTLILHKRKHTGEKPYKCEYEGCDKTFSVLSGLHLHMNVHKKSLINK